jgi:hypothetical protein
MLVMKSGGYLALVNPSSGPQSSSSDVESRDVSVKRDSDDGSESDDDDDVSGDKKRRRPAVDRKKSKALGQFNVPDRR